MWLWQASRRFRKSALWKFGNVYKFINACTNFHLVFQVKKDHICSFAFESGAPNRGKTLSSLALAIMDRLSNLDRHIKFHTTCRDSRRRQRGRNLVFISDFRAATRRDLWRRDVAAALSSNDLGRACLCLRRLERCIFYEAVVDYCDAVRERLLQRVRPPARGWGPCAPSEDCVRGFLIEFLEHVRDIKSFESTYGCDPRKWPVKGNRGLRGVEAADAIELSSPSEGSVSLSSFCCCPVHPISD